MPIPFLLAGLGVAAGVIGAGGHLSAKETNERAQKISENAQKLYNNAKHSLEEAQNRTEKDLIKLGYAKKYVLDSSMDQFLHYYEKIMPALQYIESAGIFEISKFTIDQQDVIELRKMTNIYSSSFASGATGVAAGAAVVLATSGALPIITGNLAAAGSALAAGEIGMAAEIAGSALSSGAAMTPLAAVAAPVILFTGVSASMKADENLEKANTMYAEAEAASEKMQISETLCGAKLLADLNKMFAECSGLLAGVVRKKEGRIFKKKINTEDFTEEELKLVHVTASLAHAVKSVIDTPMLSEDGNISYEAMEVCDQMVEEISDYRHSAQEAKIIDYGVKPVAVKVAKPSVGAKSKKKSGGTTVMGGARSIFAVVLGFILATAFAENIALSVTNGVNKFLFLDSFTANKIAIWLLLCSSVIMLVGRFKGTKIEKLCDLGSGISLSVLYVQYCRTVERMNHYIIFSIIFFIVLAIIYGFFGKREDKWQFGLFFSLELFIMASWSLVFLIYAFFSKFIGFSDSICLVVTSILMCLISVFVMGGMIDES